MATSTQEKPSPSDVAETVRAGGGLITMSAAARLLGILPPNFSRDIVKKGKLTPVPVEGSGSVFLLSEVRELQKQRKQRASRNGH